MLETYFKNGVFEYLEASNNFIEKVRCTLDT